MVTFTEMLTVAVLFDALAPVVTAEVSVTVALNVWTPDVIGSQFTVNGAPPEAMSIKDPLSKN